MKTALKLSLIVMIAAVFCPACGGSEPVGTGNGSGGAPDAAKPETVAAATPATLDAALALAKAEGKNVLVEYTSTTCPFCKRMDSQTLAQDSVKSALASSVVYFRAVKETNPEEFTSRFGTRPTPSFAVVSADGETVHGPVSGVIPAANFVTYVKWAGKGTGPAPALTPGGS